jgi:hypothetical protein
VILCHHPSIKGREGVLACTLLCLPSKTTTLILFWTAIVGVAYHTVLVTTVSQTLIDIKPLSSTVSISVNGTIPHAILAIVMMFYPLCGFVADVYALDDLKQ